MAHFAKLDENNYVIQVVRIPDSQEERGEEFLAKDLKLGGKWIQTSYNHTIRGKYAGVGDFYDEEKDEFIQIWTPVIRVDPDDDLEA